MTNDPIRRLLDIAADYAVSRRVDADFAAQADGPEVSEATAQLAEDFGAAFREAVRSVG